MRKVEARGPRILPMRGRRARAQATRIHGRGSTRAHRRQNTSSHAVDTPAVVDHSRITPSALKSMFGSQMASAAGRRRLSAMPSRAVNRM